MHNAQRKEMRTLKLVLASSLAILMLLTGCNQAKDNPSAEPQPTTVPVMKYSLGSNDWSSLEAYSPSAHVKEAYEFAVEHPEVLDYMPCYCGCFEEDGHVSNTHCFVESVEDNVATLDMMGLG